MVTSYQEEFFNAKYHLVVSKRMFSSYSEFQEKRFLVGLINEMALATSKIIRAYLIRSKKRTLKEFVEIVSKQFLDLKTREDLMKSLEIQRAQKESPVEFSKGDKIILLIEGKYRILTVKRIKEFLDSIERAINSFSLPIRQV